MHARLKKIRMREREISAAEKQALKKEEKVMHRIDRKDIISRIPIVLIALLLGICIYLAMSSAIGRDPMPMAFGTGIGAVTSGSMEPALSVNDLVIARSQESYRSGDIIVYKSSGSLIVHRIVRIEKTRQKSVGMDTYDVHLSDDEKKKIDEKSDYGNTDEDIQADAASKDTDEGYVIMITTKGDANASEDAPIPLSSVKGKVVINIPFLGGLLLFMKSAAGLIILAAAAVLVIELPMQKKKKEDMEHQEALKEEIEDLRRALEKEEADEPTPGDLKIHMRE